MEITQKLITPNKYSRPGTKISKVRGVVIHWVANPMTSAIANRNFFDNRKFGKTNYGSAHYIVGLDGEKIQCLPENEIGYHVGSNTYTSQALNKLSSYPNNCTLGIECTHLDWNGKMSKVTYDSTLELAVHLLKKYGLNENDLWLHKTVVGWKDCHQWFVTNNNEWIKFKQKAGEMLRGKAKLNPEVNTKDIVLVKPENDGTYVVRKGDTLWGISQQLDIPLAVLVKLNPDIKPESIQVGQEIKVLDKPKANLVIDGSWGEATTRALQAYMGTTQDGYISGQYENEVTRAVPSVRFGTSGSYVIGELQKLIGAKVDGFIGSETVRKLQSYLGTTVDGKISQPSLVVKELQRRLNTGKL